MTGRNLLTLNLVEKSAPSSELIENTNTSWNKWDDFKHASGDARDLFTDPTDRARPHRIRFFAASVAIQALVVTVWILDSVVGKPELPPPRVVKTFLSVVPTAPAPPPPPPPAIHRTAASATGAPSRVVLASPARLVEATPTTMPLEIGSDVGAAFDDGGYSIGVPGGVIGGLVGGLADVPPPTPSSSEPTIYVVSGEIKRPDKIVHVDPVYPSIATAARVEGVVILEAVIDGEGNVEELHVLRSVPLLDDAAVNAVKNWKYAPTIVGGKPVQIQMTVTVRFAIA